MRSCRLTCVREHMKHFRLSDARALSASRLKELGWAAFIASTVLSMVALVGSSRLLFVAVDTLHVVVAHVASSKGSRGSLQPASAAQHAGLAAEVPPIEDPDALPRFTSKIAHEQGIALLQMQSETLKTDNKHLGQRHSTLQLRGDYPSTKRLLIALLAKFPGLTLEHMTIRHRASGAAPDSTSRSDDECTIELIQYSTPSQANS